MLAIALQNPLVSSLRLWSLVVKKCCIFVVIRLAIRFFGYYVSEQYERSTVFCTSSRAQEKWELVKLELRGLTIPYAKNKAKNLRKKEKDLQTRLSNLGQLISSSVDSAQVNYLEVVYFQLKQELCLITVVRC